MGDSTNSPSCRKCSNTAVGVSAFAAARTRPVILSAAICRATPARCSASRCPLRRASLRRMPGWMPDLLEERLAQTRRRSGASTVHTPDGDPLQRDDSSRQDYRTERDVWRATKSEGADGETRYSCQATELLNYTAPLKWWDARQYLEAYTSGNRTLPEICRGLFYLFYYYATLAFSDRWGRPARWLYNRFQAITGGIPFPRLKGRLPVGQPAPRRDLGLQPGDLVRVKSYDGDPCNAGHQTFEQRSLVRRRTRALLRQDLSCRAPASNVSSTKRAEKCGE